MSGHNKWSSIKHKKKANDDKKSKLFSKLASNIKTNLKLGNDLNKNPKLKNAISKALDNNISKSVILKITSKKELQNKNKVIYSATLPNGVIFILECHSDNKNKIISDLKYLFSQLSGSVVQFKNVEFIFNRIYKLDFFDLYNEENLLNNISNKTSILHFYDNNIFLNACKNEISNLFKTEISGFKFLTIFEAKKKIKISDDYFDKLKILKKKINEKDYIANIFTNILNFD